MIICFNHKKRPYQNKGNYNMKVVFCIGSYPFGKKLQETIYRCSGVICSKE